MPFGKNSCLTALRHFPRWHQLACTSLTQSAQVFAQFCCSYLLPGCLINALHFLSQPSVLYLLPSSPIHPEVDNGPGELRSPQDRCGVGWKKEEPQAKDFHDYLLVLSPWITSSRFLSVQVFALMQKTDCLSRNAASLTFSVSFLAKFCIASNLRSYEPEIYPEDNHWKSLTLKFLLTSWLAPGILWLYNCDIGIL